MLKYQAMLYIPMVDVPLPIIPEHMSSKNFKPLQKGEIWTKYMIDIFLITNVAYFLKTIMPNMLMAKFHLS